MSKCLILFFILAACGRPLNTTGDGESVDFAFFQSSCLGCHTNDSRGITQALKSEASFKAYGPALATMTRGSMPKGNAFDENTITKVKEYFNGNADKGNSSPY